MYLVKKLLSVVCMITIVIAMNCVVANAEESVGDTLGINNDNSNFAELVCIEDGKAYLPLRLVFPNLNDKENKIGMTISWSNQYPMIHLIYGATNGGAAVNVNNGYAPPYEGIRSCVDITWEGEASTGSTGYLTVIKYTYDANGEMEIVEYDDSQVLSDKIYLKKVEGGDRMFASIDDINKLAELVGVDGAYSVKLYK